MTAQTTAGQTASAHEAVIDIAGLQKIMREIHRACYQTAERYGTPGNYVNGANIAGFLKVANAMMDQGVV